MLVDMFGEKVSDGDFVLAFDQMAIKGNYGYKTKIQCLSFNIITGTTPEKAWRKKVFKNKEGQWDTHSKPTAIFKETLERCVKVTKKQLEEIDKEIPVMLLRVVQEEDGKEVIKSKERANELAQFLENGV